MIDVIKKCIIFLQGGPKETFTPDREAELERATKVNQEIERLKKEREEKIAIIDQLKKKRSYFFRE